VLCPTPQQKLRMPLGSSSDASTGSLKWSSTNDPDNPFNWPNKKKWTVSALAFLATFTSTMNGTMITVAHEQIGAAFNVGDTHFPNSYWAVTSWTLGGALACLLLLPIMEDFGVRSTFLGTYFVFLAFLIPQALAQNFATLVVCRFLAGGCVALLANTSAGVIGNIWEGDRGRTVPTSLYVTAYLTSSSSGPVIAAVILENLSWRWISYMQLIWGGIFFCLYVFFFPESRGVVILDSRMRRLKAEIGQRYVPSRSIPFRQKLWRSVSRPLYMLFTEPVLFTYTIWSAFMVGTVYVFTQSVEQVFNGLYGWTPVQGGYIQAAVVIGECIGWLGCLLSAKVYFASASRNTEVPGTPVPEARLYVGILASFVGVAGGMFVYGWTSYPAFHWAIPAVGLVMVGIGINVVVVAIADYILDAYSKYAGSAVAALVLGEDVFAAFLPLSTQKMYQTLGFNWASSLLGFLALAISCASLCLIIWGRRLRARSPFMQEVTDRNRNTT
jgi:MFS family permease